MKFNPSSVLHWVAAATGATAATGILWFVVIVLVLVVLFERRRAERLRAAIVETNNNLKDVRDELSADLQGIVLTYYFDRHRNEVKNLIDGYKASWDQFSTRVNENPPSTDWQQYKWMANAARLHNAAWGILQQQAETLFSYNWQIAREYTPPLDTPNVQHLSSVDAQNLFISEWRRHHKREREIAHLEAYLDEREARARSRVDNLKNAAIAKMRKGAELH